MFLQAMRHLNQNIFHIFIKISVDLTWFDIPTGCGRKRSDPSIKNLPIDEEEETSDWGQFEYPVSNNSLPKIRLHPWGISNLLGLYLTAHLNIPNVPSTSKVVFGNKYASHFSKSTFLSRKWISFVNTI